MDVASKPPPPGFDEMSPDEQLDYIQALWRRMLAHPETIPVPDWHRQIIGERLAEYRAGKAGAGRSWEEVRRDLQAELSRRL
ncbi:MAG TPA: addiction module protein [Polyangia bacterium]|jgi:putative addiction module component (TIGR02574 family)|nr:addiction module protein [Polyangia bacterium]